MSMIDNELPENNSGMPTQGEVQSSSEEPARAARSSEPTQKQIDANRKNARFATGPRTAAGKKRVSRNAAKHFLTAKNVLDPRFESEAAFEKLVERLSEEHEARGITEELLVRELAFALLYRARSRRFQAGYIISAQNRAERSAQKNKTHPAQTIEACNKRAEFLHSCRAQLKVHGALSDENAQLLSTVLGSSQAVDGAVASSKTEKAQLMRYLEIMLEDTQRKKAAAEGELRELEVLIHVASLADPYNELDRLLRYASLHHRELPRILQELERVQTNRRQRESAHGKTVDSKKQTAVSTEIELDAEAAKPTQMDQVSAAPSEVEVTPSIERSNSLVKEDQHGSAKQSQTFCDDSEAQKIEVLPPEKSEMVSNEEVITKENQIDTESVDWSASVLQSSSGIDAQSAKQSQLESAVLAADGEPVPKKPSESVGLQDSEQNTAIGG
jgi:hypothetical protein